MLSMNGNKMIITWESITHTQAYSHVYMCKNMYNCTHGFITTVKPLFLCFLVHFYVHTHKNDDIHDSRALYWAIQ